MGTDPALARALPTLGLANRHGPTGAALVTISPENINPQPAKKAPRGPERGPGSVAVRKDLRKTVHAASTQEDLQEHRDSVGLIVGSAPKEGQGPL